MSLSSHNDGCVEKGRESHEETYVLRVHYIPKQDI